MRETPEYLEAPDNEDSGLYCECGQEVCDEGRYPELCWECSEEAAEDAYWDRKIEEHEDRMMFPEDYERDYYDD